MADNQRVRMQILVDPDLHPLLAARLAPESNKLKRSALLKDMCEIYLRSVVTSRQQNDVATKGNLVTDAIYGGTASKTEPVAPRETANTNASTVNNVSRLESTKGNGAMANLWANEQRTPGSAVLAAAVSDQLLGRVGRQ